MIELVIIAAKVCVVCCGLALYVVAWDYVFER